MKNYILCDIRSLSQKMGQLKVYAGKTSGLEIAKQMFKTGDVRYNLEQGPVSDFMNTVMKVLVS
jgi:hypothetical protein